MVFGLARSSWVLLVSRCLQGFSSAIVYTVGLALLVDTVGRDNVGQWMGTALSSSSFGLIVSPLLGGIVYARAGYAAVFFMAMSLLIVDIVMRLFMIEKKMAAAWLPAKALDQPAESRLYGTFTAEAVREYGSANGNTTLSNGHAHPPTNEHSRPPVNEHARTSPDVEEHAEEVKPRSDSRMPTIIRLLSIPRLLAAIYGIFVNVSILAAFDNVLPVFVKQAFQWDSLAAGVLFLCLAVPALTGPLVGKLSDRFGPRWISVAGCSLSAPPLMLLGLVSQNSLEQKILLCVLLTICGKNLSIASENMETLTPPA